MNRDYSYPNMALWYPEAWAGTDAAIHPLVRELFNLLYKNVRPLCKTGVFAGRTDGHFDPKTNVRTLPDVIEAWNEKGLDYHFAGMGGVSWLAMLPHDVKSDAEVLLVLHCADMSDPLWAMDTLEYYRRYNEAAAQHGFVVHYIVQDGAFASGIYTDILLELSALWRLDMKHLYLDLSALNAAGKSLSDVEGLALADFGAPFDFHGIPALDINDRWQAYTAHQFIVGTINRHNPEFDFDRLVHSTLGRRIADSMVREHEHHRYDEPAVLAEFDARGLALVGHWTQNERWLTVAPKDMPQPLPLLICMKEVRPQSEFQALTALQFYDEFIELAANGECMLLFFAMESPEDNELLCDILAEAEALYPIDRERVYITGQSHNGYLALEFARRHPELIAAIATLNDRHGISSPNYSVDPVPVSDEMLDDFAAFELPLINICGAIENVFPHTEKGSTAYKNAIDAYRRRLRAFRCPDRTDEEIEAALTSSNKAERMNGIPADRSETVVSMGMEAYISDVQNRDGKCQLRFVTLENLPHMISPQMAELSWSFLHRFARRDGRIVEL